MKIALAYNEILPPHRYGGVERVVMNLAKWYTRMGHQVFILAKRDSPLSEYEHGFYPETWNDLSDHIPADIDFLHLHQPDPKKPRKPHLMSIHGNASPGERYHPNCNFVSRSHAHNHNAKYFIYQGIDVDHFPFLAHKQDYYVFLAKAKWRVKNLRTAIDFAHDVKVPVKVIGGEGRNSKYVEYLGFLGDHEGRLEILSQARGLLYPTNWDEPCALAPLESLACGSPVIGSANGCMPEIVPPTCGVVTNDYTTYVSGHRKLDTIDPQICRTTVERNFSAERMAQDYLGLIDKILQVGELDQSPGYAFQKSSIQYLFKPTWQNRLQFAIRQKI